MLFEIKSKIDEQVIFSLETKSFKFCIESAVKLKINLRSADLSYADLRSADLRSADLSYADLRSADLRSADLSYADLRSADLSYADLRSADLRSADLRYADLRSADLRSADLRSADLSYADLSYADLRSADLDFSSGIPFWCGGLNVKVDAKIAIQMAYHFCKLDCKDKEFIGMKKLLKNFANKFHRVSECGEIK